MGVCFLLCGSQLALAIVPGAIVADPNSYTYYVQQIAKAEAQLDAMLKNLEKADISAKKLTAMERQLEGTYNRIAGLSARMAKRAERLGRVPVAFMAKSENLGNDLTTNHGYLPDTHDMSEWEKLDVNLDKIFCDPKKEDCSFWEQAAKQEQVRQQVIKTNFKRSTLVLGGLQDRVKELSQLTQEVGKGTQRDEQNLTNRLLSELLIGQQQLIALMAQLNQANAIVGYQGIASKVDTAREQAEKNQLSAQRARYEALKKKAEGIDASDKNIRNSLSSGH